MRSRSGLARACALSGVICGLLAPRLEANPATQLEALVRDNQFSEAVTLGQALTSGSIAGSLARSLK